MKFIKTQAIFYLILQKLKKDQILYTITPDNQITQKDQIIAIEK